MKQRNKDSLPRDTWPSRLWRYLRETARQDGPAFRHQMMSGAGYRLGSGAVSLLILWYEMRN